MATNKKTYPYAFYYNDGSYLVYDITKVDVEKITQMVMKFPKEERILTCSVGILNLCDMRSIIEQKVPKKEKNVLAAYPNLNMDDIEWLAQNKESWSIEDEDDEGGLTQ